MADIITTQVTVREGNELLVNNLKAKPNAKKVYRALWIEDLKGKELCCLFTLKELDERKEVSVEGMNLKAGHIIKIKSNNKCSVYIKITRWEGGVVVVRISESVYERALKRAQNNKEDIPKKGMLVDLFD